MNYNLNNLGSRNFEHLVQALCKKIIGQGVSIFGAGPDGQREATFNGNAPYPSNIDCWGGYWVIQAKFKELNTKKADYLWLKESFEEEMNNFKIKKDSGKIIPNNYLFFTNIVLTPVYEKGIKDKIDLLAKEYSYLIPNIHILGADDINRFLEGNRDVATSYCSYILSGDILSYLYESIQVNNKERQDAFHRYLFHMFDNDYCARMEQAGQLTDEKISIDKVYVDLSFREEETQIDGKFIKYAIGIGDNTFRFSSLDLEKKYNDTSKQQIVSNKYVLKGGAGQGKSTVCQFLAQIYRAAFIKNFGSISNNKIERFLEKVREDDINLPICYRVPITIELRLYSSWIVNRQRENKQYDLVTYISTLIGDVSSSKFDNETLRLYFSKYAWAFFFDGLDEVPESSNRKEVMNLIENFINIDLRQLDADAVFYATTRPEGYVGEFNKANFTHLDLLPLDKEECFLYLQKLLFAIENNEMKRKEYFKIFKQGWNNKQISFMMETPLQVTIIAILIRSGGELPRDKFSLYKEYFDIIIKREKQKGMGTILNDNQDLITGIYYLLGYELQKKSVSSDGSEALISLDDLKILIKRKLFEDGISEDDDSYLKLLSDSYSMVVYRINFASEIREGYIGFSIRSMQEFLAAVYIEKNVNDVKLDKLLKFLAQSSYWKNTFIFLVECIVKEKKYYLDHLIDTIIADLNGEDISLGNIEVLSNIQYGSQVAFNLLVNNVFKTLPKYERKLCKYFPGYFKLQYSNDIVKIVGMSDNVKKLILEIIMAKPYLTDTECIVLSLLLQDDNIAPSVKEYCESNAIRISKEYFKNFRRRFHKNMYSLVMIALQKEEFIELDLYQVISFIQLSSNIESQFVKKPLFKIAIKALLLNQTKNEKLVASISEFYNVDFSWILQVFHHLDMPRDKITEDINIMYNGPIDSGESFDDFINLCDKYNYKSLPLILKTIKSKKIEDYLEFAIQIEKYKDEVEEMKEEIIFRENLIMSFIWKKIQKDEKIYLDEVLIEQLKQKLNYISPVKDIQTILKEHEIEPSIYSVWVASSDSVFTDFYEVTKTLYTAAEITKFPQICILLEFLFSCQCYKMHENCEIDISPSVISEIFLYSFFDKDSTIWQRNIWSIAFLKLSVKEILRYENINFEIKNYTNFRSTRTLFNDKDQCTIIEKVITYICATENKSAIDFLLYFILTVNNFDVISQINFNQILDHGEDIILCLKEIVCSKSQDEVKINVLKYLENDKVKKYIFKLIKNINMPSYFSPLYLYYLNLAKNKKHNENIKMIEKKLLEYVTILPINDALS